MHTITKVELPSTTAFTIVTRNHFHFAAALSENLRHVDPAANLIIIVADLTRPEQNSVDWNWLHPDHSEWSNCLNRCQDQRMILSGESVCDTNFAKFAFQYTAFELTCALKSQAGCHLLNHDVKQAVYLDADVRLFHPLSSILNELPSGGMLLTPHIRSRLPNDGKYPNNIDLLRTGNFNAGIWSFHNTLQCQSDLQKLLNWWRDCCRTQCIVDPHDGLFVDQKWLDQAVSISPASIVSRNSGLNVGYWNLHEFDIESNDRDLIAFHFSGVPLDDRRLSTHQNRHKITRGSKLEQLLSDYIAAALQHQPQHYQKLEYNYGKLDDQTSIDSTWREAIRSQTHLPNSVANPFSFYATPEGHEALTQLSKSMVIGRFEWQQAQLHNRIQKLRQKLDRQPLRWLAKTIKNQWKRA